MNEMTQMYSQKYVALQTLKMWRFQKTEEKTSINKILEVSCTNPKQIFPIWVSLYATVDINQSTAIIP